MSERANTLDWNALRERVRRSEEALERALNPAPDVVRREHAARAGRLADRGQRGQTEARWIVLVVRAGSERFGIPLEDVRECLPPTACTPVPGASAGLRGVIHARGAIRSVLDLGRLLGQSSAAEGALPIVIVRAGARDIALAVDTVEGVARLATGELRAPTAAGKAGSPVLGVTDDGVTVLRAAALAPQGPGHRNATLDTTASQRADGGRDEGEPDDDVV